MANTNILKQIKSSGSFASVDAKWGPYASVAAAHAKLGENGDDVAVVGLTVGIVTGNTVTEYWYQGGTTQAHLVPKQATPKASEILDEGYGENGASQSDINELHRSTIADHENTLGLHDEKLVDLEEGMEGKVVKFDVYNASAGDVIPDGTLLTWAGAPVETRIAEVSEVKTLMVACARVKENNTDWPNPKQVRLFTSFLFHSLVQTSTIQLGAKPFDGFQEEAVVVEQQGLAGTPSAIFFNKELGCFIAQASTLSSVKYYRTWSNDEDYTTNASSNKFAKTAEIDGQSVTVYFRYTTEEKYEAGNITNFSQLSADLKEVWGGAQVDISGKADKSEMSITAGTGINADKTTITLKEGTSATVLTQHQDVSGKVDKVAGKGLSTNDYTNEEKAKVGTLVGNVNALNATLYGGGSSLADDKNTTVESYSTNGGHPATNTGVKRMSGYFQNYTVDLTLAFTQGYTTVRFYGITYTKDSDIVAGLVAGGEDDNGNWIVESFVPNTENYRYGTFELPITPNSKLLVATVLTPYGVEHIGSTRYKNCPDPSYVPETVEVLGPKSQTGMVLDVTRIKAAVEGITSGGTFDFPATYLPAKVYGVIGDTLQIFRRSVVVSNEPYKHYLDFVCGQGKVYERYLEITPEKENNEVPTGLTIKHRLIDDKFNKSEEVTSDLVLAGRPSISPSLNVNVLCIGASTTGGGQWPSELKRRLTDTRGSGTPAADGLSNITFVGRKALTSDSSVRPVAVNVEATGGWAWKSFYTPQAAVRFTVSGVTSVDVGTVYSYTNGNGQLVKVSVAEVNVTAGSGNIRFTYKSDTVGTGVPAAHLDPADDIITRVGSSGGDSTIAYSSAEEETYCPFYDEQNEVPDFSNYANLYCNNQIDVLMAYMGNVNEGIYGNSTDEKIDTVIANMKTLLDAFHTDFPNGKVIIGVAALANTWYGYEYNYSAASNHKTWSLRYGLYRYAKAVEEFLQGDDYKDWCFLANTHTEVDSENCYPTGTKAVNTRMAETEKIGTNGAHPTLAGYQMVADSFYRCFVNAVLKGNSSGQTPGPSHEPQAPSWVFGDKLPATLSGDGEEQGSGSEEDWQLGDELPATLSE